jgi:hypothetical protein
MFSRPNKYLQGLAGCRSDDNLVLLLGLLVQEVCKSTSLQMGCNTFYIF